LARAGIGCRRCPTENAGRRAIAGTSWRGERAIITGLECGTAAKAENRYRAEATLNFASRIVDALSAKIHPCGRDLPWAGTPEAIGDLRLAGPNHVCPPRSARFSSGLSVLDFMKRRNFGRDDTVIALRRIGPSAETTGANPKAFEAHGLSVTARLRQIEND